MTPADPTQELLEAMQGIVFRGYMCEARDPGMRFRMMQADDRRLKEAIANYQARTRTPQAPPPAPPTTRPAQQPQQTNGKAPQTR